MSLSRFLTPGKGAAKFPSFLEESPRYHLGCKRGTPCTLAAVGYLCRPCTHLAGRCTQGKSAWWEHGGPPTEAAWKKGTQPVPTPLCPRQGNCRSLGVTRKFSAGCFPEGPPTPNSEEETQNSLPLSTLRGPPAPSQGLLQLGRRTALCHQFV